MTTIFCVIGVIIGFLIYRQGFKDGLRVQKGSKPEKIIPASKKSKEPTETEKRYNKGMASILDYRNRDKRRSDD